LLTQAQLPLKVKTPSGLWQVLRYLGISYKRARDYLHSPDPDYDPKLLWIAGRFQAARNEPQRFVILYVDELTFYRQPSLASAYGPMGHEQPRALRSYRSDCKGRIIAGMDACTGRVTYLLRPCTDIAVLRKFHFKIREAYPDAETIYLVEDNWPMHAHPDVLASLQKQTYPWSPRLPARWAAVKPREAFQSDNLPIQLLFLPTYAPWTNPIEKLWRWLYQEHLHLHRLSDAWDELQDRVRDFLDGFKQPSPALLHYVGLLPN